MGCRSKAAPTELVRVTRSVDGRLALGRTLHGRGAWLCAGSVSCFDRAVQRRAFDRALRAPVPAEAIEALRIDFVQAGSRVRG